MYSLYNCVLSNSRMMWLVLHLLCLKYVRSSFDCECTTQDCVRDGINTCTTDSWCYSQLQPRERIVVRGCIDQLTPLLCENRPPSNVDLGNSWPILKCCSTQDCNRDAIPQIPKHIFDSLENQHEEVNNNALNSLLDTDDEEETPTPLPPADLLDKQHNYKNQQQYHNTQHTNNNNHHLNNIPPQYISEAHDTINPLYIGIPVAGACILLALVIFAIYIIKRQNQLNEEYHYRSAIKNNQAPPVILSVQPNNIALLTENSGNGPKNGLYTDCERNSATSVTKLLFRV